MILPVLEYGDTLYDGANLKLTGKLQILQNRCLRTCLMPNQHIPTIRLHEVCNIAKLNMRRKMHLQLYMYKQKTNLSIVIYLRLYMMLLYSLPRSLIVKNIS